MGNQEIDLTPDIYPARIDFTQRQIQFCRMSRESYRQSPFLDHRIVKVDAIEDMQGFDALPDVGKLPPAGPVHYIFHNAFCCSTLLSRYLDRIGGTFVLREPNCLYEVASYRRFNGTNLFRPVATADLDKLFVYTNYLLARRYQETDRVIIKPSDGCNNLIRDLMEGGRGNTAVFLYSGLERFLASVLRDPKRDEWARIRVRELSMDKYRKEGSLGYNPQNLNRWQNVAMIWALHMERFRNYQGENAVLVVDSQSLIEDPFPVLSMIARHFSIEIPDDELKARITRTEYAQNAKAEHERYSPEMRERDFQAARLQYSSEIDDARNWISGMYGSGFVDNPLSTKET